MLGIGLAAGPLLAGADDAGRNSSDGQAVQQQLEELRHGQERILKELAEIRQRLAEKPVRADYLAKPVVPNVIPLNVHGEPFRGDPHARVAIVEYSNFECSFCGRFAREMFPRLNADYIQTGKVKYFFRDLTPPDETNALLQARALRCAGEQGKFWEMHDFMFGHQGELGGLGFELHTRALGLDGEKLNACLTNDRYAENIRRSTQEARQLGILGTPAFLIGAASEDGDFVWATKVLVGVETYDAFRTNLDERLEPFTAARLSASSKR